MSKYKVVSNTKHKSEFRKRYIPIDFKIMETYNFINEKELMFLIDIRNKFVVDWIFIYPSEFIVWFSQKLWNEINPKEVSYSELPLDNIIELISQIGRQNFKYDEILKVIKKLVGDKPTPNLNRLTKQEIEIFIENIATSNLKALWGYKFYKEYLSKKWKKEDKVYAQLFEKINSLVNEIIIYKYNHLLNEVINKFIHHLPSDMEYIEFVHSILENFIYLFLKIRVYGKVSQSFVKNYIISSTLKAITHYIYFTVKPTDINKYITYIKGIKDELLDEGYVPFPDDIQEIFNVIEGKKYLSDKVFKNQPKGDESKLTYEQLLEADTPTPEEVATSNDVMKKLHHFVNHELKEYVDKVGGYFDHKLVDLLNQLLKNDENKDKLGVDAQLLVEKIQYHLNLCKPEIKEYVRKRIREILFEA